MKAIMFISKVILLTTLFLGACSMASASNTDDGDRKFINNDVVKDGNVVSREIYALNETTGALYPVKKCEYEYDALQLLTQKTTYNWNSSANKWTKTSLLSITRNLKETSIVMAKWINKKKGFAPTHKFLYVTNNENNRMIQYTYKMNKRTKEWELQRSMQSSIPDNIYASTK